MRGDAALTIKGGVIAELSKRNGKPASRRAVIQESIIAKPLLHGSAGRYRSQTVDAVRNSDLDGWKERTKYHKRSLVEAVMFQIRPVFVDKLKARRFDSQSAET